VLTRSDTGGATATDGAPSTVGTTNTASTNAATPTSTSVSSSSSSAGAKPSSSSASSSAGGGGGGGGGGGEGGGEEFEGEATFYAPGLGSCGTEATDDDYVAALSKILFDATGSANANNNPYCGRKAFVKAAGGKRRRWDDIGNVTGGVASWEKSRNERWSRRSVLSTGRVSLEGPAPSRNESGNNHEEEYSDNPPMPGITPPPKLEMDLWQRQEGGGGVTITIVDRCPVCKQYDLDLSPAAYNVLGDEDAGRIPIKWKWLD
jgi:hypothetical protein